MVMFIFKSVHYVYACASEYDSAGTPVSEASDPPGAGVTRSCKQLSRTLQHHQIVSWEQKGSCGQQG